MNSDDDDAAKVGVQGPDDALPASNSPSENKFTARNGPHGNHKHLLSALLALENEGYEISLMRSESHQGPIAHPNIAQGWEVVLPGSAERILRMSEEALQAEISLKHKEQNFTWFARFVGQLTGGLLGVGAFLIALKAIDANMPVVAGTVVTVTLVTLAGLIITGRWQSARVEETSGNDTTSSPPSLD